MVEVNIIPRCLSTNSRHKTVLKAFDSDTQTADINIPLAHLPLTATIADVQRFAFENFHSDKSKFRGKANCECGVWPYCKCITLSSWCRYCALQTSWSFGEAMTSLEDVEEFLKSKGCYEHGCFLCRSRCHV